MDSSSSTIELVKVEKNTQRINILWVICPMLLDAFGEIFFFSSLSCVVGILCVWGAFISSAWCPTPDPQRQMLQDCKTCNCREFLESNANHTALGVCVCVCLSFFIFSSQKCIFLTVPASFNAVQGVERKTSQTKQL